MLDLQKMIHDLETLYMSLSATIDSLDADMANGRDTRDAIARLTQEAFNVMDAIKALRKAWIL
jgi:hypothetical protein